MTILGTKNLGEDLKSGLQRQLQIFRITIDGDTDIVTVSYRVVLISPKGTTVSEISSNNFLRFDRPAVVEDGKEIKPANNKFSQLHLSPLGQMILGMLKLDLDAIKGFDTIDKDLEQL